MTTGDDRVAEILAEWRASAERGEVTPPDEVVRLHPEQAAGLRRGFAALVLLDRAIAEAVASSEIDSGGAVTDEAAVRALKTIGDFRLLREIGRGAMGVVYEAEQVSMGRRVALKVLYPSITLHPKAVERFRREARAAGQLHHTNIVAVHGMGSEGGTWFYAMEWVEGRPLSQVLADRRRLEGVSEEKRPTGSSGSAGLSTTGGRREEYARVARAFAGLADALSVAHAAGIVHRDVKPSNVLLDGTGTLKLLDFGLARLDAEAVGVTATGDVVGTPQYMSPEQARSGPVDARTDVYSLGATLYEVLTSRPPVAGRDIAEVLRRILSKDPPPPRALERRIPRDLETIVLKAMEKDPARRFRTAAEMARDLTVFAEGGAIRARRIGLLGRAWRGAKRHRIRTSLSAAVVVLAAVSTAFALRHAREVERRAVAEYDGNLEEAMSVVERRALPVAGGLGSHVPPADLDRSRGVLLAAIRRAPDRPEAYLLLSTMDPPPLALARLEEANARGLPARLYRLARADVFRRQGKPDESSTELALARGLAEGGAAAAALEAGLLLASGKRREAIERATYALAQPGAASRTALRVRADAREAEGDVEGSIEDLATLREGSALAAVVYDVRIAALWGRIGRTERAQAQFDRALDRARKAGTEREWQAVAQACGLEREYARLDAVCGEALVAFPGSSPLWYAASTARQHQGDLAGALRCAEEAIRLEPKSGFGHAAKARALHGLGQARESVEAYRVVQDILPDSEFASEAAVALAQLGHADEAIAALERMALRRPDDHGTWHNLGEALFEPDSQPEMLRKTLVALDRAVELDPLCVLARARRVAIRTALGRFEDAIQDADAGIALAAELGAGMLYVAKARALRGLSRLPEALASCRRAIAIGARDPLDSVAQAHLLSGAIFGDLGQLEDSLAAADHAIGALAEGEVRWSARWNRASCLLALGRHEGALAEADAAIRRDRGAAWHTLRGTALTGLGRPREALEAFDRALVLDASEATRQDRGLALMKLGLFEDALRTIDSRGDPDDRTTALRRALVLVGLERPAEARLAIEALARRLPDDLGVWGDRVGILRRIGALDEARRVAAEVIARLPPSAVGESVAGLVAVAGDHDRARRLISIPTPGASMHSSTAYNRACVCAVVGDREEAFRWLELAASKGFRLSALDMEDPDLATLTDDPRLSVLRERMRIR